MSNRHSKTSSPSNSPKLPSSHATPEVRQPTESSATPQDFTETPQAPAEQPISTPVIIITGSPSSRAPSPESTIRQGRSLGHRHRDSTSQPPRSHRSSTPYEQPRRSSSQPEVESRTTTATTMSSSSSSPGNTSTAGASSGSSNPSYQLPYAPFPYPMPANARGSGQQQSGGQSK
ncbi:uncharacterized protein K460DRAFT_397508 [Cucurbitaria berberidis CBS 394.84]|uniref:Uncharacterized protein n=1 Tax=Cucurbitaria berberidis CBS 394.84 TaxID=1168544 RepID=A0A9P4GFV1_9PLEO|nr:uncharacterized protein K460DRAFT_397508 [Cucurbitaria berberidis CBS 394.84]KAF1844405.1 hypothetical protein K460DRAFT_397508 [Cucurbitaria berberidis CBS 394.84]